MESEANTVSVLFVDDDTKIQNIVKIMLTMNGFSVTCTSNADEASEILRDTPFDVLVTDHLMPGKTGLDLIREVHKSRPGLANILITGTDKADLGLDDATMERLSGIIEKPFGSETLVKTIRHVLRKHSGETG